jgi:hypothetical protein
MIIYLIQYKENSLVIILILINLTIELIFISELNKQVLIHMLSFYLKLLLIRMQDMLKKELKTLLILKIICK